MNPNDFNTKRHASNDSAEVQTDSHPRRHPDLCFDDGNVAILAGSYYFLVHRGLLRRRSAAIDNALNMLEGQHVRLLEGRLVLELDASPKVVCRFLLALYDGISTFAYDINEFGALRGLLRLVTTYQVDHLRTQVLCGLSAAWPSTLAGWEIRESNATNSQGVYEPRRLYPHPILVINLAREINSPELIPSAMYDLSRFPPSDTAAGYRCPETSETHQLSHDDLMNLLKGREHASRFLSNFIFDELERREPVASCIYQKEENPSRRRTCQAAFEAITFEILRDTGAACNRSSDPLYAISDAELMQTRDDLQGAQNSACRACEHCRAAFGIVVDAARENFWHMLPLWFGVDLQTWD